MTKDRSPVGRLMGAVVPQVVDAVDVDHLIEQLDVDALMERVDVDALLTRIDIDALMSRVDVDALISRVDLNGLLTRIDIDALLARIDVSALIGRIDMNEVIGQVDLNALLDDVDIKAIVAKAGIDEIVAEASTGILARTIDLARRQLVGIDIVIMGAIDRLFRRKRETIPDAPRLSATGRPAGPVSRFLAFGADLFLVSALFSVVVYFGREMVGLFTGDNVQPSGGVAPLLWSAAYFGWFGIYLWGSIEIAGRTPGKALVGLRVTDLDGQPLGPGRALVRTLVFPFSFILGLGFIPAIVRKDRRALHELVGRCKEIVDWGDRQASIPSALEGWVERQRDARVVALVGAAAALDAESRAAVPTVTAPTDVAAVADEVVEIPLELAVTPAATDQEEGEFDDDGEAIAALSSTPVLTEAVDPAELVDGPASESASEPDSAGEDEDETDYWAG